MKLYRITSEFWGKDLNEKVIIGYIVAENDEAVYAFIESTYIYVEDSWPESVEMTREAILAAHGDFDSKYLGEFYDQKFGWEDCGGITAEEIATLQRLGVLPAAE